MASYKLLDKLGEGGMGVVFRAIQEPLGREVAIKFLPPDVLEGERLKRFEREIAACIKLRHPNIVEVWDFGETDGKYYYVMQLLNDATPLDKIVKTQAPLEMKLAARLMDQLLDALAYCHSNGFIHRDIKPANIMVLKDGHLILMDFGLVKDTNRQTMLTQEGKIYGTPHYLAPELLRGKPAGAHSDLFAAGGVFYELLTGKLAFPGSNITEIAKFIIKDDPMPVGEIRPDLPPATDTLMQGFLAKDPAQRFKSAADAREAVSQWLTSRPAGMKTGRLRPIVGRAPVSVTGRTAPVGATVPSTSGGPSKAVIGAGALAIVGGGAVALLWRGMAARVPDRVPVESAASVAPVTHPDVEWGAGGVRVSWVSARRYAARVEARLSGQTATVCTTTDRAPVVEHTLSLDGLRPQTVYDIDGHAGDTPLFNTTGSTRPLIEVGRRLQVALDAFGAWDLLLRMRSEFRKIPPQSADRDARRAQVVARWVHALEHSRQEPSLESAIQEFAGARDAYFGSMAVPIEEKRILYLSLEEVRELEDATAARKIQFEAISPLLASGEYGASQGTRLAHPRGLSLIWLSEAAARVDKALSPNTVIREDPDDGDRFIIHADLRVRRFEPARTELNHSGDESILKDIGRWHSEPDAPLALPDPATVARAELRAIIDAHPTTAFRIFLMAPGGRWRAIADLRTTQSHEQVIWHGLDPRVLSPGAHLKIEMLYFEENGNPEQSGYLRLLEFRWEPKTRSGEP